MSELSAKFPSPSIFEASRERIVFGVIVVNAPDEVLLTIPLELLLELDEEDELEEEPEELDEPFKLQDITHTVNAWKVLELMVPLYKLTCQKDPGGEVAGSDDQ